MDQNKIKTIFIDDIEEFKFSFKWYNHRDPVNKKNRLEKIEFLEISMVYNLNLIRTCQDPDTDNWIIKIDHPRLFGKWQIVKVDQKEDYLFLGLMEVKK